MNIELINQLQDKLSQLSTDITDIKKELIALKVDRASMVKAEKKIGPGTGCKITYNASGLVTNSMKLESSDIPVLPMSKISGLSDTVAKLVTRAELSNIYDQLDSVYTTSDPVKSGTKVNIDSRGLVTDVANLIPDDIPELPMSKIEGLQKELDRLSTITPSILSSDEFKTKPGTGCRITWDTKGRVTASSELRIEDLPRQIVDRINTLESRAHSLATITDINRIDSILNDKLDRVEAESGIFTKVVVNSDGLVIKGSQLTKADIPQLTIEDIPKLSQYLADKVSKDDIDDMKDKISQLEYRIKNNLANTIPVLGNTDIESIKAELSNIQSRIDKLTIPDISQIMIEIANIKDELSTLTGRISVLEKE